MKHIAKIQLAALLLAAGASGGALAGPAPSGQGATLRIELELTGKDRGKPVHRTVNMVVHLTAQETTAYDMLAKTGADENPSDVAERERRSAKLDRKLAVAREHQHKLDMDAMARACNADQDSAECKRGQAAFAQSMAEVDQAMRESMPGGDGKPLDSGRYQQWVGVPPDGGQACGTIEGRVLDGGKAEVTRIPRPGVLPVSTCFSTIQVDHTGHRVSLHVAPLEILRANATERGDFLIDGTDVDSDAGGDFDSLSNSLSLRNTSFRDSGGKLSGSAAYKGWRGVTMLRWSLERD
jgi:hypothetical protein